MSNIISGEVPEHGTLKGKANVFFGKDGDSAYAIACRNGFVGTEKEWLDSLNGGLITVDKQLYRSGHAADAAVVGEKFEQLSDYITPEMFGAVGDGVADDTVALQNAVDSGKKVVLKNRYAISKPIILGQYANLQGNGVGIIIKKTSDVDADGNNGILIIKGTYISIEGLILSGSIDNGVNGIVISTGTRFIHVSKIHISLCLNAVVSKASFFMATFNSIHAMSCENAFNFSDNSLKTSTNISNSYAANCGTAYTLYGFSYSTIENCGADMCNYKDAENPYYDGGHGSKSTGAGIYNFISCENVGVRNCATEKSWGNGAINVIASRISVDGFTAVDIKSEFVPDYTNFPGIAVGAIQTSLEYVEISLKNIIIKSFVNTAAPSQVEKAVISLNYSEALYGEVNKRLISIANYDKPNNLPLFGGLGDTSALCFDETSLQNGSGITYPDKQIFGNGNTLFIPVTLQGDASYNTMIELSGCNCEWNTSSLNAFSCIVAVRSLSSVQGVELVQSSNESITVAHDGKNIKIKFPNTYTALCVGAKVLGANPNFIKWKQAKLVTS
jgi:hypothetical protein